MRRSDVRDEVGRTPVVGKNLDANYYLSRRYRWFWPWHALFDGTWLCRCERSTWMKLRWEQTAREELRRRNP